MTCLQKEPQIVFSKKWVISAENTYTKNLLKITLHVFLGVEKLVKDSTTSTSSISEQV